MKGHTSTPETPPCSVLSETFDTRQIKKVDLDLTPVIGPKKKKLAFVLTNVLTPEECQALITMSEKTGYSVAKASGQSSSSGGRPYATPNNHRNGQRLLIDDAQFAMMLEHRIAKFLPGTFKGKTLIGINERLRFLKCSKPGDKLPPRYDGSYAKPDGSARSLITVQLNLNEGFRGGETKFLGRNKTVPVIPKMGQVLVFEHRILHEGSEVTSVGAGDKKYSIRLDVLYTSKSRLDHLYRNILMAVCFYILYFFYIRFLR